MEISVNGPDVTRRRSGQFRPESRAAHSSDYVTRREVGFWDLPVKYYYRKAFAGLGGR
jgi:hypothetical protein